MSTTSSVLFRHIEQLQSDRPWGRFLDAGTGAHSLRWISSLTTSDWTAITASEQMADEVRAAVTPRPGDRLLVGNWLNDALLMGERFDTVLMDYLIGAIEGFAPYWQERAIERMRPLVAGRLYITGVEPYVPFPANTESGRLVREIGCLRDACLLLAGERPYREFPLEWVQRQLGLSGFRLLDVRRFPIRYGPRFINGQLNMCRQRLARLASTELVRGLEHRIESLRAEALSACEKQGGLAHGADYVLAAEPA